MKSDVPFPFETAGWPALLVDGAGVICRANPSAVKLFGVALEGAAAHLAAVWSPENQGSAEQFLAQWERAPLAIAMLKFRGKGGQTLAQKVCLTAFTGDGQKYFLLQWLPESAAPAPLTPPPAGEPDLAHKQKLDCALQLARTVALDFNNALTSILGHTSLVLSQMEANHPWRTWLLEVEKSAAKAAEIANDLGTFSRQEKEARTQAAGNLNQLVQRTVEFFQKNSSAQPVEWKVQLERKLFAAKFDEAKMQQALMKIVENSLQALRDHGRLNLQTRNVELAEPSQDRNVPLAAGAYVCVEINDNGRGIEPAVLPRVFEPFFTTKGGSHRGLGLAWVYGIVTNHGGGVAISSQPEAGTSVRVYLPAQKQIVRDEGVPTEKLGGNQTILLVDDEELLLTMGQTILSAYGYRVLTANSGQKALDLLTRNQTQVHLVITDLVMPAMSGRELVERIRRLSPAMRILCTSGYVWPAGQEKETAYLQKPFTSRELLLKVKQTLNENIS
ncbi:MAG TPA: ATP-binding protein [Candidatus Binatia bacterium]|jgi:two-component system cell cycle sensor histidine kinase/response regulator CckA|nr:ATP-binding protein [Candidatus Binatia bacterium]